LFVVLYACLESDTKQLISSHIS